jgi:hypothetical protein
LKLFFMSFQPPASSTICLPVRKGLFSMGVWEFLLPLTEKYENTEEVQHWIWQILRDTICVYDNEDPAEFETVKLAVEHGAINVMVKELRREPARLQVLFNVFSSLTTICLDFRYADRVIESGAVEACLRLVEQNITFDYSTSALGSLKNLAITKSARPFLLQAGALQVAQGSLRHLRADSPSELKFGLCAASLICRLMDGQETGPLVDMFAETEGLVLRQLHWLLNAVLRVGPVVIGSGWNPANIVMDLAILAQPDENKRYMVDFVPLLALGLQSRGLKNMRLTQYAVDALLSIGMAIEAKREMIKVRPMLLRALDVIIIDTSNEVSAQIKQSCCALRLMLENLGSEDDLEDDSSKLAMDMPD